MRRCTKEEGRKGEQCYSDRKLNLAIPEPWRLSSCPSEFLPTGHTCWISHQGYDLFPINSAIMMRDIDLAINVSSRGLPQADTRVRVSRDALEQSHAL